jgi:hypothetical protein
VSPWSHADEPVLLPGNELRVGVDRLGRMAASRFAEHADSEVLAPTGRGRRRPTSPQQRQDGVDGDDE